MTKESLIKQKIDMFSSCPGEIMDQMTGNPMAKMIGSEIISAILKGETPEQFQIDDMKALMSKAVTPMAENEANLDCMEA